MESKQKDSSDPTSIYGLNCFIPDDFIFLLLRLINYPDLFPHTITNESLNKIRFKKYDEENHNKFLINLKAETGIEIIMSGNATIREIIISETSIENIKAVIDIYLQKFRTNKLEPIREEFYRFDKQKEYFLNAIQNKIDLGFTDTLIFSDSEIEKGYSFFESFLVLEKDKYLTIKNIRNYQDKEAKDYYQIQIKIKERKFKMPAKSVLFNPDCIGEKGVGYLKYHKNSKKIRISKVTSKPYRLLHCLSNPFGIAKKIDVVYEILTKKEHRPTDEYLDLNKKITAIRNTVKELQKIPEFRERLKIIIDIQNKHVRLCRKDENE